MVTLVPSTSDPEMNLAEISPFLLFFVILLYTICSFCSSLPLVRIHFFHIILLKAWNSILSRRRKNVEQGWQTSDWIQFKNASKTMLCSFLTEKLSQEMEPLRKTGPRTVLLSILVSQIMTETTTAIQLSIGS